MKNQDKAEEVLKNIEGILIFYHLKSWYDKLLANKFSRDSPTLAFIWSLVSGDDYKPNVHLALISGLVSVISWGKYLALKQLNR